MYSEININSRMEPLVVITGRVLSNFILDVTNLIPGFPSPKAIGALYTKGPIDQLAGSNPYVLRNNSITIISTTYVVQIDYIFCNSFDSN